MARLALSIVGGILGAFLIPGVGASLGFAIGSALGGIIGQLAFPGKGTHVYGPRVNDMQVSSSAPGQVIPLLFGSMRLGGQIIWSTGLQEKATTTSQSSKGMPSVTQTTYTYSVSFASAFCQGPAQTTRIWGDSKLIYNKGGSSGARRGNWNSSTSYNANDIVVWAKADGGDDNTYICMVANTNNVPSNSSYWAQDLADTNVNVSKYSPPTFYTGSETQTADPLIVAKEGANVTPAYRGVAYAVWEDFPLADFGNRLPNIRAEVTSNGQNAYPYSSYPWSLTTGPSYVTVDPNGEIAFVTSITGTNGAVYVERINLETNEVEASGQVDMSTLGVTNRLTAGYQGALAVDANGYLWGVGGAGSDPNEKGIIKLDPWTFKALEYISFIDVVGGTPKYVDMLAAGAPSFIAVYSSTETSHLPSGFIFYSNRNLYYNFFPELLSGDSFVDVNCLQQYPVIDDNGFAYIMTQDLHFPSGNNDNWRITKINIHGPTSHFVSPGPFYADATVFKFTGNSNQGLGAGLLWNPIDGNLIVYTNTGAFLRIDVNDGAILEQVGGSGDERFAITPGVSWEVNTVGGTGPFKIGDAGSQSGSLIAAVHGRVWNGVMFGPAKDDSTNLAVFSANDFSQIAEYDLSNFSGVPEPLSVGYAFDPSAYALMFTDHDNKIVYREYLDRLSTQGDSAAVIVQAICELSGLTDDDVDTSLLSAITVKGYPITSLTAGKDMINTLGQAYFFEGRESDFKLQFVPRGQVSLLTVPETDLGMEQDNASLTEMVGQEQDIPKSVEILHIDPNADYQQGHQKRIRHSRTKKTLNQTSISLPLVMNSVEAAQLADKIMWTAENERRNYKTNFWKAFYLLLDPCDVIKFNYHGTLLNGRVTNSTIGQNFAAALDITSEDSDTYISVATGVNGSGFQGQTIQGLAKTILWLLDMPYLRDQDADAAGNIGYYFAMAPSSKGANWPAGVLYNSSDDAAFNQIDASAIAVTYGIAQNALGTPAHVFAWDYTHTLTVRMVSGSTPVSDTALNVLNGKNAAVLFPSLEVIQFTTATTNMDGTVTLSGLLRGRRGTDDFTSGHTIGEIVLFPLQGGVGHEQTGLGTLNLLRYYKGITVGSDLNSQPVSQQLTLRGRDLQPYAPAAFYNAPSSGDILFTWFRRTRLGGSWNDGTGQVPLSEDTESYDLTILDGGGTVVRTFVGIIPPGGIPDSWTSPAQPHQLYTAAQQTADGYLSGNGWSAVAYQNSSQVGRGFPTTVALP